MLIYLRRNHLCLKYSKHNTVNQVLFQFKLLLVGEFIPFSLHEASTIQHSSQTRCASAAVGERKTAAKVSGETAEDQKGINGGSYSALVVVSMDRVPRVPKFNQILVHIVSPLIQYHCALNSCWTNCKLRTVYMKLFPWNMRPTFVNSTLHVHFLWVIQCILQWIFFPTCSGDKIEIILIFLVWRG